MLHPFFYGLRLLIINYMQKDKKIDIPENHEKGTVELPRENPFRAMMLLLGQSVGKLPAHLVILFVAALVAAVAAGIFIRVESAGRDAGNGYLVRRLDIDASQPQINPQALRGIWAIETPNFIATLKIGKDSFEYLAREKNTALNRFFIRGGYRTEGDLLIMQSRTDLGSPLDPQHLEYRYAPIAFRDINIHVSLKDGTMVWNTPEKEKTRIFVPDPAWKEALDSPMPWVKIANTP